MANGRRSRRCTIYEANASLILGSDLEMWLGFCARDSNNKGPQTARVVVVKVVPSGTARVTSAGGDDTGVGGL